MNGLSFRIVATVAMCGALLLACTAQTPEALIASGNAHLAKGELRTATIQFKAALQLDPNSAEARHLLGTTLLAEGDPGAAVTELTKAVDLKYDSDKVIPPLARALLLTGQYRKITSLYGQLTLNDRAAGADLKTSVANAWAEQGERAQTEANLEEALKLNPEHAAALILRARILAGAGNFDEALAIVDRVVTADPKRYDALHLKGELLLFRQDTDAALAAFRAALDVQKAYLPAHRAIMGLLLRKGDIPGIEKQVAALRAVLPNHAQTRFAQAQLAFVKGDVAKARELTLLLLRLAPEHSGTLYLAGAIEQHSGSLLLAETHLSKALQNNPRLTSARRMLATGYLRMGQPAKALTTLQPLLDPAQGDAVAAALAGDAHLQLGNSAEAERQFTAAASLAPDNPRFRTAVAMAQLARGNTESAFSELENVASTDRDGFADLALISARMKRGEFDAALKAADALIAKQPTVARGHLVRGRIQLARNNVSVARADFEKALQIDPKFFPAATALASLDLADGKRQDARARFEQQLLADPRNYEASLALAELASQAGASSDDVAKILDEAIKRSPTEPALRVALVANYLRATDIKRALEAAQQGNASLPGQFAVVEMLGAAQLASGDHEQALNTFRQLVSLNPRSPVPHLRLVDVHLALKDKAAAERSLRSALQIQPRLDIAQRRLMQLTLADNRPADALAVARAMQTQRPADDAGYLYESDIQLKLKDTRASQLALRNGLKQTRSSAVAQRLHMHLVASGTAGEAARFASEWERDNPKDLAFDAYMAGVALAAGKYELAETRFRRVLKTQPEHSAAMNNLAWLLVKRGDSGALALAEAANARVPNRPAFMDTLAAALAANGQAARALEVQKQAVERAPEAYALRLHLAKIAIQAGDLVLAKTELEKLARLGSRVTEQSEVTRLLQTL
jgi:cellulose synthase operon protein C